MPDIAGLKLIVPTSVAGSGVSVSASGKVTFTTATDVSLNGVFSSTYDNYLIVCRFSTVSSPNIQMRMRLSGTDNSTANSYVTQFLQGSGTSVSGARYTTNFAYVATGNAEQRCGAHFYIYGPNLAQPTAVRSVTVADGFGAFLQDNAATHNQSTAYDGVTIYAGSNSWTGALTIYGLSQ